jgi:hypothetical protein
MFYEPQIRLTPTAAALSSAFASPVCHLSLLKGDHVVDDALEAIWGALKH